MSDKNVHVFNDRNSFTEHLGIVTFPNSGTFQVGYSNASEQDKNVIATACALELIKSTVQAGNTSVTGELRNLEAYVITIKRALAGQ